MKSMKKLVSLLLVAGFILPMLAQAHSGGLDRKGCHYDRKTGIYHCH